MTVAYAKRAYLGPVPYSPTHNVESFIDYTQTVWVNFQELRDAGRIAALDHDARACLIRREIYYKYRWKVPLSQIQALEKIRIDDDPQYQGPKPSWA